MSKTVALIPLRGGSKRIPGKNIKPIAGRPLAYWVCAAARNCKYIDDVYVSTEDEQIASVVQAFNLDIQVVKRPPYLATDVSTTDDVMLHFMTVTDFDLLATVQATSPLLAARDLDLAIEQFVREGNDSLLSGVVVKRFFWTNEGRALNYDPLRRPFTQAFDGTIMENGAFYLTSRSTLDRCRNRLGGKIGIFRMAEETAAEIDDPADWVKVERLLSSRRNCLPCKIKQVKIIVSDFDGVWTDNKVYTFGDGSEAISCSKADSLGLEMFRSRFDLPVLVVTKEKNQVVQRRCSKLQLEVISCADNKCDIVSRRLADQKLSWADVCYIGNDLNDLDCMSRANLTFCPADAVFEVRCKANYILSHSGGDGAIREMLELLSSGL